MENSSRNIFGENNFKLIFDSIDDQAFVILDLYGSIIFCNTGTKVITGYEWNELVGNNFKIFYPKNYNNVQETNHLNLGVENGKVEKETWILKKNGSNICVREIIKPFSDDHLNLKGFLLNFQDLSYIKQKEKILLDKEQKQELVFKGIESLKEYAIITLDTYGYITTWNSGAERIKGYKQNEIIGKHFSVFFTKDAIEAGYPDFKLQKAFTEGKYEDEGWRIKKDGTKFWANIVINSITDLEGHITGFTKITRDLTDKKEAEKAIKATEEKYRLLIEKVEDYSIFMLDQKGFVSLWNAGAEKINGYKAEEVIGKHFSIFFPKKAVDQGFPEYELKMGYENGKFSDLGWRLKKDGNLYWANIIITPIIDESNYLIGYSQITRDLTEQKKAERILVENEERYRLLIEAVKDYAILMLDYQGNVSTWNTGAEKIKGYKPAEIIGRHFSIFYPKEAADSGYPEYELKKAREDGRFEDEGWRIKKDGSSFWANIIITPIKNHDNKLIGYTKVTKDLTERKNAELTMEKKNMELTRINADLDNFIYTASHDLKAPIANIEGIIDAIKSLKVQNQELETFLLMMSTSVEKFKKTILDLTEVTSLQMMSGLDIQKILFSEIVEEVEFSLKDIIFSTSAIIKTDFNCEFILFSRKNLRSLFFNLISNALKYKSPDRNPEIYITINDTKEGHLISVSDNGIGIDPSKKNSIFLLFKRLHNHVDGSGVGLFIVKRIVDNAGGKIEVETRLGEGTQFNILLK